MAYTSIPEVDELISDNLNELGYDALGMLDVVIENLEHQFITQVSRNTNCHSLCKIVLKSIRRCGRVLRHLLDPMSLRMNNSLYKPQMMNVDKTFKDKANDDYQVELDKIKTEVSSISTRDIIDVESIANDIITGLYLKDEYQIDAKPYVERPFYAGSMTFSTTDARYSYLNSTIKYLPGDVIRSNVSLLNAMKIASLYRSSLVLNISASGTIGQQGCVLIGITPPLPKYPITNGQYLINTLLSGPHAFLNFNEATVANLEVPWYCNMDLASLDMDTDASYSRSVDLTSTNGNYATLVAIVLNPLAVADGASTSMQIIIEACFKKLDMYVPTPRYIKWVAQSGFLDTLSGVGTKLLDMTASGLKKVSGDAIDSVRSYVKSETGLHNPNVPFLNNKIAVTNKNYYNTVDAAQFFEKLHPFVSGERVVKEPIFGTELDEMNLAYIHSKKQMLGTFSVSTTDVMGKLKWVRPISPFQGGYGNVVGGGPVRVINNIEMLHSMHNAWKGSIRIHIQSVMNNKQQVKLKMIKYYNPSTNVSTLYPEYTSIVSAPSHLLEFTQGGQEHVVELPYLSRNELMPCAEDMSTEALLHGLYYIYLAQPLVNSDGSPLTAEFNVFISLSEGFQWFGYATKTMGPINFSVFGSSERKESSFHLLQQPTLITLTESQRNMTKKQFYEKYVKNWKLFDEMNNHVAGRTLTSSMSTIANVRTTRGIWKAQSGMKVMNTPQPQNNVDRVQNFNSSHNTRMLPNEDIRPTIRRMYRVLTESSNIPANGSKVGAIPLSSIVGQDTFVPLVSPIYLVSRMFYGKSIGFKFAFYVQGLEGKNLDGIGMRVHYVTPNMVVTTADETVKLCAVNTIAYPDAFVAGTTEPPVPIQAIPVYKEGSTAIFEFSVPNTTYIKFVGSPEQFNDYGTTTSSLATSDCGSLVLTISNSTNADITVNMETFVGLTDESRLGMHSIAPPFYIDKSQSTYLGNPAGNQLPATNVLNPTLYLGGFAG